MNIQIENTYCKNLIPRICYLKHLYIKCLIETNRWDNENPLIKCLICKKRDSLYYLMEYGGTCENEKIKIPHKVKYGLCILCKDYDLIDKKTLLCKNCRKLNNLFFIKKNLNRYNYILSTMNTITNIFCETKIEKCNFLKSHDLQPESLIESDNNTNTELNTLPTEFNKILKLDQVIIAMLKEYE